MPFHAIVGGQRGDEGKGRFVDLIAADYTVVARGNGGANAGHTVAPESIEPIALHQIPAGIVHSNILNVIGNGVFLDPIKINDEISNLLLAGIEVNNKNLVISSSAHLVMPHHLLLDLVRESGNSAQGSTKSGIAFVAGDKYTREGLRLESVNNPEELLDKAFFLLNEVNNTLPNDLKRTEQSLRSEVNEWLDATKKLKIYMADTVEIINKRLSDGEYVLGEGAQAFWLDINHGMYPYVTSSSTTVTGLLDGLGVSPKQVSKVSMVIKAIKSHVGGGPFLTEITDAEIAQKIRGQFGQTDSEYGATTKRPRRIGYLDLVELRKAILLNGADELFLTKLDHVPRFGNRFKIATEYELDGIKMKIAPSSAQSLGRCTPVYQEFESWDEDISNIRSYGELPTNAKYFIDFIETELQIPIKKIGVGPNRNSVILRD